MQAQGGEVISQIAIPPTETSFFKYFPQIPAETDVIYHVMVGPGVLTFVKEMGDFYGTGARPEIFGFIDSLEAVAIDQPGLEFLEATYFLGRACRAMPPPDQPEEAAFYREGRRRRRDRRGDGRPEGRLDLRPHVRAAGRPSTSSRPAWRRQAIRGPEQRQGADRGGRGDGRDARSAASTRRARSASGPSCTRSSASSISAGSSKAA